MTRRVPILNNAAWVIVATEDEITVRQRREMQNSLLDASAAQYALTVKTQSKVIELEKLRTAEEREYEKRLTADEKKNAATYRAGTATMLAFRELSLEEQTNISQHQRVKIRSYLRSWSYTDKDIPVTDDDFDNLTEVLFDELSAACADEVPDAPDLSNSPDNRADPKAPTAD